MYIQANSAVVVLLGNITYWKVWERVTKTRRTENYALCSKDLYF